MLDAHSKNDAVGRFLGGFQYQLPLRRQRIPNKISTLAHLFNVSNLSSFHPLRLHRKCERSDLRRSSGVEECGLIVASLQLSRF